MTLETELYKRLRIEKFGVDNRLLAARSLHQFLIDEGHPKPPDVPGCLQMIQRAEKSGAPTDRSTSWPYYMRLIGIETQRPTLEAAMAALGEVDERLEELAEILSGLVGAVEEQTKAISAGRIVRLDDKQLREGIRAVIESFNGPFSPERFLKGVEDAG